MGEDCNVPILDRTLDLTRFDCCLAPCLPVLADQENTKAARLEGSRAQIGSVDGVRDPF